MDDLDRMLQSVGSKSFFTRDSRVGDSVSGPIVSIDVRPATDYTTKEVMIWPSGDVKEQIVVTIRADGIVPEDEDDDLHRSIYIKGWGVQRSAFIEAAKDHKPQVGDIFTATFVAEKPNPKGGNPAKVYEYRVKPIDVVEHVGHIAGQAFTAALDSQINEARAQALKLIGMGSFTDEQVAAATALPLDEVRALSSSTPF